METKRCVGYKVVWACGDDYPDHMVPVGEFGVSVRDGLQDICRRCKKVEKAENSPKYNPKRKGWYILAGGRKAYYALSKEGRAEIRAKVSKSEDSTKPKFDDGNPSKRAGRPSKKPSKRTGRFREGPGYVYIYQDERIHTDLKIGSSKYSHGRLGQAGTWGCYRCLHEVKFPARYAAEDAVHTALDEHRLYRNKEIFRVDVDTALDTILKEAERETKVG